MLLAVLAVIAGIVALVKSADVFVEGSSGTAKYFGMSDFLIGMLILGFGTSAPELLVSASASFDGKGDLALGNAFGSNICNIALILGVTALIRPVTVKTAVIRSEMVGLLLVTLTTVYLLWDHIISRADASALLLLFAIFVIVSIRNGRKESKAQKLQNQEPKTETKPVSLGRELLKLFAGLVVLVLSSKLLVWGAVEIATILEVSNLVIGLTIVAVGTSLPELASSIAAAMKGNNAMAIGNVVGSNMFNTLAVTGLAGVIQELKADPEILVRDVGVMTTLTALLILFSAPLSKKARATGNGTVTRIEGAALCAIYIGYTAYLICTAGHSGAA